MAGRFIRGDYSNITYEALNSLNPVLNDNSAYRTYLYSDAYDSKFFREIAINAGYELINLYPIYWQGWELDYWGAIGKKDGKMYRLETNHGNLTVEEI